jgi:5-methylcytosine-specific restriction endonuclease McrA
MARNHNTDRNGTPWTEQTKKAVWEKGIIDPQYDKDTYRKDKCGYYMQWSEHGNRDSKYGWEIDHINPVSNGGDDSLQNLQPLYWENNANKSDKTNWECPK